MDEYLEFTLRIVDYIQSVEWLIVLYKVDHDYQYPRFHFSIEQRISMYKEEKREREKPTDQLKFNE